MNIRELASARTTLRLQAVDRAIAKAMSRVALSQASRDAHGARHAVMRRLAFAWLVAVLGLASSMAHATCSFTSGTGTNVVLTLPASVPVPLQAAVNTIIYDSGWSGTASASIKCGGGEAVTLGFAGAMTAVTGMSHVYATGVPGIGIKVAYSNTLSASNHPANIDTATGNGSWLLDWPRQTVATTTASAYSPAGVYRVQYVVTGPLTPGAYTMTIPNPTSTTQYGSLQTDMVSFTSTTITIQSIGCQVLDNNIVVSLPNQPASAMKGVGTAAGAMPFQIPLLCNANVKVAYEIDGTPGSGVAGVLANQTGNGYATGVGVQLLQGTTPVALNTLSDTYIATTSDNQTVNIPFSAQYFQTGASIAPGAVQSTATFQMNYQ